VQFAAFGDILVDRGPFPGLLVQLKVAGRKIHTGVSDLRPTIPKVAAGVWPYVIKGEVDGVLTVLKTGSVEVRPGEVTTLSVK
jgi:hypothetical protein